MLKILISILKLLFLQNYRLDHFEKGRNRIVCSFGVALGRKAMNSVPALESRRTGNARLFCRMDSILFRNSCFS